MFITFEGIEGSGKSSLIAKLKKYFKISKIETFFSKEPGGTDLGKEIRKILLNHKYSFDPTSELLLLLADRAEHVQNNFLKIDVRIYPYSQNINIRFA